MKITILTQYFPPEVGAPQNRLYELALLLQEKGAKITVITAMPNYPSMQVHEKYRNKFFVCEEMNGLKIIRSWIYVSKSKSRMSRLLTYFSFTFTSFLAGFIKPGGQDILLCESPPLFLGKTGWLLSVIHRSKFVFNVSDLWPESAEKLGLVKNKMFLGAATILEEFLYRRAWLITGQTQGIVNNIKSRFPGKKLHWLPNGVDPAIFVPQKNNRWRMENGFSENDFLIIYAGIIGYAQGLEIILYAAERTKDHPHIKYILLGSGPEKEKLMTLRAEKQIQAVFFFDPVSKNEMKDVLASVNAAVIPLRKLDLFTGAIPSKIFENLAMKIPVLLGVDGEARQLFVEEGKCALYFEPENANDLVEKILHLHASPALQNELGENGREYVSQKFNRGKIAHELFLTLNEK